MWKLKLSSVAVILFVTLNCFAYSYGQISMFRNHQIPKFTSYSKSFLHNSDQYGSIYRYQLQIHAYDRVFTLDLRSQSYIFHPNITLDFDTNAIALFNRSQLVFGSVKSQPETQAYGYVYTSGQFQGIFTLERVKYYIEDSKFFPSLGNITDRFLIYRNIDMTPYYRRKRDILFGKKWLHDPLITSSSLHESLIVKRQAIANQSATEYQDKTTCLTRIDLDQKFIQRYGSQFQALVGISILIQGVNQIFRQTDFNGDGQADGVGFAVEFMSAKTNFSRIHPIISPSFYFRNWTAHYNYSQYCMGLLVTDHTFNLPVLGIANSGYKPDQGICTKYFYQDNETLSSSNVGMLTVASPGVPLIYPIREMVMAHEIGHIFGSAHDKPTNSTESPEGHYIMHPALLSGRRKNNYLFSPYSKQAIYHTIVKKGRNKHTGCFIKQYYPLCGNGIIDEGEECDCGYKSSCKDPCCTPAYLSFLDMTNAVPCSIVKECRRSNIPSMVYIVTTLIGSLIMTVIGVMFWKRCISI